MTAARFEVVCELDLGRFEDPRVGHRTARRAHAELRRLARRDWRIDSTRRRRSGRHTVEISVTVAAANSGDALDHCQAMLRTAVHATGGSTHGWEQLCTTVRSADPVDGTRSATLRRPSPLAVAAAFRSPATSRAGVPSWAAVTATARQRNAVPDSLPPLAEGRRRVTVIDLRDE